MTRVYTNVVVKLPRTRRECSLCFITHLPTACPGERVGVVAPARKCSGCFLTHLPAKCPEEARRRMETVDALVSAIKEGEEKKAKEFLSSPVETFRAPYRQDSKPVGYVSHSRQQLGLPLRLFEFLSGLSTLKKVTLCSVAGNNDRLGPVVMMRRFQDDQKPSHETLVVLTNTILKYAHEDCDLHGRPMEYTVFAHTLKDSRHKRLSMQPREREKEKQTNAQLFGVALHRKLEHDYTKKVPPTPKEPLSLTATMVGRKGERKTLQVLPGVLSRFAEVLMTDASCGVATRVHQVFVGASPQIVPAFVRETTASLMARIEAGFMIFRHQAVKRMLDTCQKELSISFDVEFLEDASFSVRLVGECCRGC